MIQNKQKIFNRRKDSRSGITLIALVITVIVLLILAGVAVSIGLSGDGLFSKADEAKRVWNEKVTEENAVNEMFETLNSIIEPKETVISKEVTINDGNGYVGYYADMDNDGIVDGIIYADVIVGNTKSDWHNADSWNIYNIPQIADQSTVKDYCISKKTYTGQTTQGKYSANAGFGLKDVIVPSSNSTGTQDRFYIMQLSDFTNNSKNVFYWYYNAWGKLDTNRRVQGYEDDFGQGKTNTIRMIDDWNNNTATYGAQTTTSSGMSYIDLWGAIQDGQYNLVTTTSDSKKWFVPSKSELSAFVGELEITKDNNFSTRLPYDKYWTSSYLGTASAFYALISNNQMTTNTIDNEVTRVRLSATF